VFVPHEGEQARQAIPLRNKKGAGITAPRPLQFFAIFTNNGLVQRTEVIEQL
jgi:hypothetical protein